MLLINSEGKYLFMSFVKVWLIYKISFSSQEKTHSCYYLLIKSDYDNVIHSVPCQWKFDEPRDKEWVLQEYNPNYESLTREGVIKGYYVN